MDIDRLNNSFGTSDLFPRNLSAKEKEILFTILPENKPGYKNFRERIEQFFVIGNGRFGETNFVLGAKEDEPDFSLLSAPVFAVGGIQYESAERYILIHEEQENKIEFDISLSIKDENFSVNKVINKWTYSDWIPGMNDPKDESPVREVKIDDKYLVLVVSSNQKRIWIFESETGVNHLIPVTNFYNEAINVLHIRDPKTALNSNLIFENPSLFSDENLRKAFFNYNKSWKKINLDYSHFSVKSESKNSRFFPKLFKRG